MRTIIIQGSARSKGNTFLVNQKMKSFLNADLLDLKSKNILPYDYLHENAHDDFKTTMEFIVENYDLIIFSTPVYWYAMSGILKNFFDRISDCLQTEKELGRKLRTKKMAAISCGSDATIVDGFYIPFKLSAAYLGMEYLGELHTWVDENLTEENIERIQAFAERLSHRS